MKKRKWYKDVADDPEDKRIEQIVRELRARPPGSRVGCITDNIPGKLERYISKVKAQIPEVAVLATGNGPVDGAVYAVLVIEPCASQINN